MRVYTLDESPASDNEPSSRCRRKVLKPQECIVMLRFCPVSLILSALLLTLALVPVSRAQPPESSKAAAAGVPEQRGAGPTGWQTELGIGVIVNPESVGGADYRLFPVPYFDFRYLDDKGTRFFANIPQGIGGYLHRNRDFTSGRFFNIAASIAPGFNVRNDDIPGLKEVNIATEARLSVETGGRQWTANATLAQDIGSGHEGMYLDLSAARRGRVGSAGGFYAVGPVLRLGDSSYKDSLFAITPAESVSSGLPQYTAGAGLERLGLQGLLTLPVGQSRWRWTGIARASRLIDNAADSPVVEDKTQLFVLMSITRRF